MQSAASRQASRGRARIIGISKMSGGIGKNELSTNDTTSIAVSAFGPAARRSVRSYTACSISRAIASSGLVKPLAAADQIVPRQLHRFGRIGNRLPDNRGLAGMASEDGQRRVHIG